MLKEMKNEYKDLDICYDCEVDDHDHCPNHDLSEYETPVCGCERCLK